jgi:outer membrane protein TolC
MAELDARVARADYLPDVSLTVGYLSPWGVEFLPKNVVTAGVSLSWEVFDGGRRAKELAEKRKAADEARLKAKEAEELAVVQVAKDVRKVEETRRLLGAARLSTAAAKERLRVARNKYDTSAALLSDLLRAQTSLADASLKESEALLSYWTARADYEKSHGEDL